MVILKNHITYVVVFICLWFVFVSWIHPYYVSVTELKNNAAKKTIEVSCRMFTDNIEDALEKIYKRQIDILHPKDKQEVDKVLLDYLTKHLLIKVNQKGAAYKFIGYEKEEEAIWCYLEINNVNDSKSIVIENSLLFDFIPTQTNVMHVTIDGKQKSTKVTNPEKEASFSF